ncbi:MAG: hypothetical protein ACI4J6_03600 [Oscillospiraceae bacterium]
MVNEQVTTIELTAGTPSTVEFSGAYPYYWVDNRSAGDVYASLGTPEAGTDGTYTIAAGSQLRISGGAFNTKLCLLGSGKVQVIASAIASCPFKMPRKGGGNNYKSKIIYNIPLKTSLEDISGYSRITTYSGDTEQTISAVNGLYLYNNSIKLDMNFLNNVINDKFVIDFDFQFNSTGTSSNPYWRRIMYWPKFIMEIAYSGKTSLNTICLVGTTSSTSVNTYGDMIWHHGKLSIDLTSKSFIFDIDNGAETLSATVASTFDSGFYFGHDSYGLNGYIKNVVITTGV